MSKHSFRSIWLSLNRDERDELARSMGTTYRYLQRLSGGFASPSLAFAVRLQQHLPTLDLPAFRDELEKAGKRSVPGGRIGHRADALVG